MQPYYSDEHVVIYHGDCREVLPEMPKVDLVLTDPPYGIGVTGKSNASRDRKISHNRWQTAPTKKYLDDNWDTPIDQADFDRLVTIAPQAIIWGGNHYATPASSCWLIWDKQQTTPLAYAGFELAFTTLPCALRVFRFLWSGFWHEAGYKKQIRSHLTEKPIPLLKWCINLATDVSLILDPYMGSGTTLRAAKDLGLQAIGIEIEERYCEIAARRMQQQVLEFEQPAETPQQEKMIYG